MALILACLPVAVSCGEVNAAGEPGADDVLAPLAVVTVPSGDEHGWRLDPDRVRLQQYGEQPVAFFSAVEGPAEVEIPIPASAAGAGHVALRVMGDGEFQMALGLGGLEPAALDVGNTRRKWRELLFPLAAPLAVEPGARMTVRRVRAELPVLMESVRFMP